jgi:hypothetical protein
MRAIISLTAAVALGCSASTVVGPGGVLRAGEWGGDHANLTVTSDSARVEFDCASGWLDTPIVLDAAGHFEVGGSYRFEAGPVGAAVPARWSGVVVQVPGGASLITLSGTVMPSGTAPYPVGPFHLLEGQRVTVFLCA